MSLVGFGKLSKSMESEYMAGGPPGNLSHPEEDKDLVSLENVRPQKRDFWKFSIGFTVKS